MAGRRTSSSRRLRTTTRLGFLLVIVIAAGAGGGGAAVQGAIHIIGELESVLSKASDAVLVRRSMGLAFDEGRHSRNRECNDPVLRSVDETLGDQVRSNWTEAGRASS